MRILLAILLTAGAAFGQGKTLPSQGPPPKNLTKSPDGHVTANQDPAKPGDFEVRVVKAGDTLSAIAGEVLKDPKLWPQLWEQNEHIINPHWIYPSDKILVRPVTRITEAAPPLPAPAPEPPPVQPPPPPPPPMIVRVVGPPPQTPVNPPPPQDRFVLEPPKSFPEIKTVDLYCSGFVRAERVGSDLKVLGRQNSDGSALSTEGDYIYIGKGSDQGIRVGNVYEVVRPTKKVTDPARSAKVRELGTHYLQVAQARIVMAQPDFSLARITYSCEAAEIGDLMIPFERVNLPAPPRPRTFNALAMTSGPVHGSVVMTKDARANFGSAFRLSQNTPGTSQGSLATVKGGIASDGMAVYVDLGKDDGVKPGDVFIIYRNIDLYKDLYGLPAEAARIEEHRTAIGELVVLKVEEHASTALVTYSTLGVSQGDVVERR